MPQNAASKSKSVLIINAHTFYAHSPGLLNRSMVDVAKTTLTEQGHVVKVTHVSEGYDPSEEVQKHVWADVVIIQSPCIGWDFPGK